MITKKELEISNKSYTNKDFQKIYPEVIELVQTISSRWNPETTNESDPGNVLLKLASFIGDKNNYNTDKNVLECFMPSATQWSSMQKLCEAQGSNINYYNSAIVDVDINYLGNQLSATNGTNKSFILPKFKTTFKDIDNQVTYTLIEDNVFTTNDISKKVVAIEGVVKQLNIGNSTTIHLENLDDNNRIYIPEVQVAQNGIFISYESQSEYDNTEWELVSNLNVYEPDSKIYKFGFDSNVNLPYIEFSSSITRLIKSGLNIWYTLTSGEEGNIAANVLTKLGSPGKVIISETGEEIDLTKDNIILINNKSSSIGGTNVESIEEAYNNFKREVGTFETLITCRDYANYIYRLISEVTLRNIVSNVQVADRRDDINNVNRIVSMDERGVFKKPIIEYTTMTPFDLNIYALKPILSDYNQFTYNQSFEPLSDLNFEELVPLLDNVESISHNILNPTNKEDKIFLIKNNYCLDGRINTFQKVNKFEQQEIIKNVKLALMKNFNARQLEYGEELPMSSIIRVIENADSRIESVNLAEPKLYTNLVTTSKTLTKYNIDSVYNPEDNSTINWYVDILAKNILDGKLSLFENYEDFSNNFGNSTFKIYKNLQSISTKTITPNKQFLEITPIDYKLRKNEVIQLIKNKYVSSLNYPYGYTLQVGGNWTNFKKNEIYRLVDGDTLTIKWTTSDKVLQSQTYQAGELIKANFDLKNVKLDYVTKTGEEINIMKEATNEIKFNNIVPKQLFCYWITNKPNNKLFLGSPSKTLETILDSNEYFIYTNSDKSDIVILGSGTKIKVSSIFDNELLNPEDWRLDNNDISINEIVEHGINAIKDTKWKIINNKVFTVSEMEITTLSEGDSIKTTENTLSISNEFKKIDLTNFPGNGNISFIFNTNSTKTNVVSRAEIQNNDISIRARLDLLAGPKLPQALLNGQVLEINYLNNAQSTEKITINGGDNKYIEFDTLVNKIGGSNINLLITKLNNDGNIINVPELKLCEYIYKNLLYPETGPTSEELTLGLQNLYNVKFDATSSGWTPLKINGCFANIDEKITPELMFSLFYQGLENINISDKIVLTGTNCKLQKINETLAPTNSIEIKSNELSTIKVVKNISSDTNFTITLTPSKKVGGTIKEGPFVIFSQLHTTLGVNSKFKLNKTQLDLLKSKLSKYPNFYYLYTPNNTEIIDVDDLSTPEALWNYNNVANKFTLSKIDLDNNFNIKIAKSSQI